MKTRHPFGRTSALGLLVAGITLMASLPGGYPMDLTSSVGPVGNPALTLPEHPTPCAREASSDPTASMVGGWECWMRTGGVPCNHSLLYGAILRYDGDIWTLVTGGRATSLQSVEALAADDIWSVGQHGTLLHWGGAAWEQVDTPTHAHLYSLGMVTPVDGWAVGYGGAIIRWDGSQWIPFTSPTGQCLRAVAMDSAIDGWIVGEHGVILHWNGATWSQVASPTSFPLYGVAVVGPDEAWAVGSAGLILRWNGATWTEHASPSTDALFDVAIAATDAAWAVGYPGILSWDGASWTTTYSDNSSLYSVTTVADTGWAVGWKNGTGVIMRREEMAWSSQPSPTGQRLLAVAAVSPREAWAVGEGGAILHYLAEPTAVKVENFLAASVNNSHVVTFAISALGAMLVVGMGLAGLWMQRRQRGGSRS